jgi:hypothetical protein
MQLCGRGRLVEQPFNAGFFCGAARVCKSFLINGLQCGVASQVDLYL